MRCVAVYMPHGGYKDEEVDAVYDALEVECREARAKHLSLVIAGDFNAQVGSRGDDDDERIIGVNPGPRRSARGALIVYRLLTRLM